ncbi:MAG: acyl-CoA thioesterase [Magnetospiraceae bacterium]
MERPILMRGVVHPWHHDHYGHMNVRWYAHFFDDAAYHLWPVFGINLIDLRRDHGLHTVTAKATTNFILELSAGSLIVVDGAVSRLGSKSVTFEMRMINLETDETHATYDVVEVMFDPETRASAPIPEPLKATLSKFLVSE